MTINIYQKETYLFMVLEDICVLSRIFFMMVIVYV